MPGACFVIIASGDRNFVVKPEQHASSAQSGWHPGADFLDSLFQFLATIGVGLDLEIDDPTFIKLVRRSGGGSGWLLRTLDFATAGYDPVMFAEWQCSSSICNLAERRSSDHRPVEIRFRNRARPKPKKQNERNKPIPAWLFKDDAFVEDWMRTIRAWSCGRSRSFAALGEFADVTRTCAKVWLEEHCVEATSFQHKFELAVSMQMSARLRTPVPMSTLSRRL